MLRLLLRLYDGDLSETQAAWLKLPHQESETTCPALPNLCDASSMLSLRNRLQDERGYLRAGSGSHLPCQLLHRRVCLPVPDSAHPAWSAGCGLPKVCHHLHLQELHPCQLVEADVLVVSKRLTAAASGNARCMHPLICWPLGRRVGHHKAKGSPLRAATARRRLTWCGPRWSTSFPARPPPSAPRRAPPRLPHARAQRSQSPRRAGAALRPRTWAVHRATAASQKQESSYFHVVGGFRV
jgi:hypothetical protein